MPCEPAFLGELHRRWGRLPWARLLAPAQNLAAKGFRVSPYLAQIVARSLAHLRSEPLARELMWREGRPVLAGDVLRQPQLAQTLAALASNGPEWFGSPAIAAQLRDELRAAGVNYGVDELASYRPRWRRPVRVRVPVAGQAGGDLELVGCPAPSCSAVAMALVGRLCRRELTLATPEEYIVWLRELKTVLNAKHRRLAVLWADPARFVAETLAMPTVEAWQSGAVAAEPSKAAAAREGLAPADTTDGETTHLVVWDKNGMIVSITLTLGTHFGSGRASKLGFFFNSEGALYRRKVAVYPADYPRIAGPVAAKAPMIVLRGGRPLLAIGGAGADRIIANVAAIVYRVGVLGESAVSAVRAPRCWTGGSKSDLIGVESSLDRLAKNLKEMGLPVDEVPAADDRAGLVALVQAISDGRLLGVADHRRDGDARVCEPGIRAAAEKHRYERTPRYRHGMAPASAGVARRTYGRRSRAAARAIGGGVAARAGESGSVAAAGDSGQPAGARAHRDSADRSGTVAVRGDAQISGELP